MTACADIRTDPEGAFEGASQEGDGAGMVRAARRWLSAVSRSPEFAQTGNYIATRFWEENVEPEFALRVIDEVLDRFRSDPDAYNPQEYTGLGWERRRAGKLGIFLYTKGRILERLQKFEDARFPLEEAADLTSEPEIIAAFAGVLERLGRFEGALYAAEWWLREAPRDTVAAETVARIYLRLKGVDGEAYAREKLAAIQGARKEALITDQLNRPAPGFSLRGLDGHLHHLADYTGRVVVLDFWATWCSPCREAFPHLAKVIEHYHQHDDVVFLEISTDTDTSLVRSFIREQGYNLKVLFDDGVRNAFHVPQLPTWIFIDKQQNIRYEVVGYNPHVNFEEDFITRIESLLR